MLDLIVASDPAVDRPIAEPEGLSEPLNQRVRQAPLTALRQVYQLARQHEARGVVLCGSVLDQLRASPAQVIAVRRLILEASTAGCETIWVTTNPTAPREVQRMLGEPAGLSFATPLNPWTGTIRSATVELWAIAAPADAERAVATESPAPLHRRLLIGCEAELGRTARQTLPPSVLARPDTLAIWAAASDRGLPPGVLWLPPLQPRSREPQLPEGCHGLRLYRPPTDDDVALGAAGETSSVTGTAVATWQPLQAAAVVWRTICIESAEGDHTGLADTLWRALEPLVPEVTSPATARPLTLVDCQVSCGTSVDRRIEVGAAAEEALRLLRERCRSAASDVWCEAASADADESLAPLGHSRSGGRPGASNSFTSALADIVTEREATGRSEPLDREAAWLALELLAAD